MESVPLFRHKGISSNMTKCEHVNLAYINLSRLLSTLKTYHNFRKGSKFSFQSLEVPCEEGKFGGFVQGKRS